MTGRPSNSISASGKECRRAEAIALIRGLVHRIVLTPEAKDGKKRLSIDLIGALAGMLALAANSKKPVRITPNGLQQIKLVAGVGFDLRPPG
jgi:hypothetical protein